MTPRLKAVVDKWSALAHKVAPLHGLDPALILAIICQESSGEPHATRFEPHYRWLWFARELAEKHETTYEKECQGQMTSWGLMQIMGAVAREYGFQGELEELLDKPELAVEYGCKHLKALRARCHEEADLISSYNQGSPKKTVGGLYLNQKGYVDPVAGYLRELRKLVD